MGFVLAGGSITHEFYIAQGDAPTAEAAWFLCQPADDFRARQGCSNYTVELRGSQKKKENNEYTKKKCEGPTLTGTLKESSAYFAYGFCPPGWTHNARFLILLKVMPLQQKLHGSEVNLRMTSELARAAAITV
ncbi:hypothetical protein ElyMa_007023300 [Elysia marginata]|uniref:Uncharacterized protein n=1 Tax=Elysia marginata TaxID=1093978 RepID=A0AAV4JUV0_9GAST|nr:hypothetical protein ElyMa_007023300 [Elysia marginata]